MIVLNDLNLQYCQLTSKSASSEKIYPGLYYQGLLFVRVEYFANNQFKQAVAKCRQFLDREQSIVSIIVKETNRITLWSEANQLNLILPDRDNDLKNQSEKKAQQSVMKYRGKAIVKPVQKSSFTAAEKIKQRKKKLKYRGSSY